MRPNWLRHAKPAIALESSHPPSILNSIRCSFWTTQSQRTCVLFPMPVISTTGAVLVIGREAPMEVSAIVCRMESLNQRRRSGNLSKFLGRSDVVLTPSPACDLQNNAAFGGSLLDLPHA